MTEESYRFTVEAEDQAAAGRSATALADALREADGVLEALRVKADNHTMDLGMVVSVLATSGATLSIARGLAAWLRARRGVTLKVERDGKSGSLKAAVAGIDPEAAVSIVEIIRAG
jgi:Effector Associated Constant Component 1